MPAFTNSSQANSQGIAKNSLKSPSESSEKNIPLRLKASTFTPLKENPDLKKGLAAKSLSQSSDDYYLVQFDGPITPDEKNILEKNSEKIYSYIPDYAFLTKLTSKQKNSLQNHSKIRWVGPYLPAYRISPDLASFEGQEKIRVKGFPNTDASNLFSKVKGVGAEVSSKLHASSGRIVQARATASQVKKIARKSGVRWIEPYARPRLFNDTARWVIQSGVSGYTPIHDNGIRGENQIIAIADTGLSAAAGDPDYPTHEMFYDSDDNVGINHRKVLADYVPGDSAATLPDTDGHGTHVAGTVAGDDSPWGAYNGYDGQAFAAKIVMQDIENDGRLYFPSDLYENLFGLAYDNGARIHTNSWGSTYLSPPPYSDYGPRSKTIDNFMWNNKNFQILFAMGNDGPDNRTLSFEAQAKNTISVGATYNGENDDLITDFSSRGPAEDNRIKPTVVAPGAGEQVPDSYIWSAYSNDNTGYWGMAGTSMSTPAVAGAVSLIRQYYENGWYPAGASESGEKFTPSSALLRATLIGGAEKISGSGKWDNVSPYYNKQAYPNQDQGWGRVTLENSLYFKEDNLRTVTVDNSEGVATGENYVIEIEVDDNAVPLKFVLSWTDYPGDPSALVQLVNNLDLEVTTPTDNTYLGNNFTSYAPAYSTTGGTADNRNVEEVILLSPEKNNFPTGKYKVKVSGANVPFGESGTYAQPFALFISGGVLLQSPPLISPADNEIDNDSTPTFNWDNQYVSDNYEIWVDNNPDFNSPEALDNTPNTTYTPSPTIG